MRGVPERTRVTGRGERRERTNGIPALALNAVRGESEERGCESIRKYRTGNCCAARATRACPRADREIVAYFGIPDPCVSCVCRWYFALIAAWSLEIFVSRICASTWFNARSLELFDIVLTPSLLVKLCLLCVSAASLFALRNIA